MHEFEGDLRSVSHHSASCLIALLSDLREHAQDCVHDKGRPESGDSRHIEADFAAREKAEERALGPPWIATRAGRASMSPFAS